jgi:tRNA U34 2-thiouridine synthase MnmA/TrmU
MFFRSDVIVRIFAIKRYFLSVVLIVRNRKNDKYPSPDCSGNPFLKKKIAAESWKKLQKNSPIKLTGELNIYEFNFYFLISIRKHGIGERSNN